jgi:putative adenylate-forming enzyme
MTRTGVMLPVVLRAFARARWGGRFASRAALLAWQATRVQRFVRGPLRQVEFYRRLGADRLEQLPVVDKAVMLADFAAFNRAGVRLATAQAVAERAERERDFAPTLPGGLTVGLSSGTSGQRAVFLVSARERSEWAGTMLARTLPGPLLRRMVQPFAVPLRVAFFLRANSNLYTSVGGRRLRFEFFDLAGAMPPLIARLAALRPDVLIAPASVLRELARATIAGELELRPAQVISVAEVLEADDAQAIEAAFGRPPAQVYQCTEGLLGQTCTHGSLHLNEEFVHFEPEWLDGERTRFVPVLTDFTRRTQVFARFRLDDVLRVDPRPCACGRHTLRLAAIEGRRDDVLWLPERGGGSLRPWFPDQVRRAMLLAAPHFADYQIEQDDTGVVVRLQAAGPAAEAVVRRELEGACAAAGLRCPAVRFLPFATRRAVDKRRRIRGPHRAGSGQDVPA